MKVLVPEHSGFCPGVKNAERRIMAELAKQGGARLAVLGELIHNRNFIDRLRGLGVDTIAAPHEAPDGATVFIRTHGVDRRVEAELRERADAIDLTCGTVKRLQELVRDRAERGAFVVIAGTASHPETIGLVSYAKDRVVIETVAQLDAFLASPPPPGRAILVISQTTGDPGLFRETARRVSALPGRTVEVVDSICPVTSLRERSALALRDRADLVIVVGDPKSSNAGKLFKALDDGRARFVEDLAGLKALGLDLSSCRTALVVSSSSTPGFVEREIVEYLESV